MRVRDPQVRITKPLVSAYTGIFSLTYLICAATIRSLITVAGRWLQVRFGTRILSRVGTLAVPGPVGRHDHYGRLVSWVVKRRAAHGVALTVAERPGPDWKGM